jgi:hypothetical protein|tara:strand:+ start:5320 stop:6102 length:783 start_codon:yes stop_codon:yes gene_type:complete
MKKLIYQVYVGKKSRLYNHCTKSVVEYAKKIGAVHICQTEPILRIKPDIFTTNRSRESYEKYGGYLPIFEKENAFSWFHKYDQIAIIDADVYIRENSPSIFDELTEEYDFGGVVERSAPIENWYKQKLLQYSQMQFSNIQVDWKWNDLGAEFINMGIMVMNKSFEKYLNNQSPRAFLNRSEFKPFVDGVGNWKWSTDQVLLNTWIKKEKMKVKNLHWKWNGLFTANSKINECHFIHFFLKDKLPENGENVNQLMEVINAN